MRIQAVLAAGLFATAIYGAETMIAPREPHIVKSVEIHGGGSDVKVKLATRAGEALDPALLRKDVRSLWSTGQYADIRVQTAEDADGTSVIFDVSEKPQLFLRDFRIEPNSFGLQPKIPLGSPIDDLAAQRISEQVRKELVAKGYVNATAEPELTVAGKHRADLKVHVEAGSAVRVKDVEIVGDPVFPQKEVMRALQAVRARRLTPGIPGVWGGFISHAAYNEEAVDSDLARLQSFYIERGYFDARVSVESKDVTGEDAHLRFFVKPGPHYFVNQIMVSGTGVDATVLKPKNGVFQTKALCGCLLAARREAEKKGIVDFTAHLNMHLLEGAGMPPGAGPDGAEKAGGAADPVVDLTSEIQEGRPYTVNRIEISGSNHFSEASIRRNLLLDEGDVLDPKLLRKSLARLNQTQMFDPIEETQVTINTDEKNGTANILIPLHERHRGMWNLSGPVGPVSFAGPLQFMLASRLPPWGRGIFEMSTYYLSFSMLGYFSPLAKIIPLGLSKQGILPVLSLFRPYTPGEGWKSGILIAPQLGWQTSAYSYAASQLTSRLVPVLQGDRRYTQQLSLTFERPDGDGVLLCDPPQPKFHAVRMGAAMLLQFVGSVPMF